MKRKPDFASAFEEEEDEGRWRKEPDEGGTEGRAHRRAHTQGRQSTPRGRHDYIRRRGKPYRHQSLSRTSSTMKLVSASASGGGGG